MCPWNLGRRDGTQFSGRANECRGLGLTIARSLNWHDGRGLAGEDMLLGHRDAEKRAFDREKDAVKTGRYSRSRFVVHLPRCGCHCLILGGAAISRAEKR